MALSAATIELKSIVKGCFYYFYSDLITVFETKCFVSIAVQQSRILGVDNFIKLLQTYEH